MTVPCFVRNASIKALMRLLSEKGIISKDEFMAKIERLHREMKEKGESKYFKEEEQKLFRRLNYDDFVKSLIRWQRKKIQMQGAQILRNEAYIEVRCNDLPG